jgi:hypothetical protein
MTHDAEGHPLPIRFFRDFLSTPKRAVTSDREENTDLQVREGSDHLFLVLSPARGPKDGPADFMNAADRLGC